MKKILVVISAALLIGGCFLPIMSIGTSTRNFFDEVPAGIPDVPPNALKYAAIAIIGIALASALIAFINRAKFLWLSGILTGIILTGVYFGFHAKLDQIKEQTDTQLKGFMGGLFRGVAESMFQTVQLGGIGWYVISTGALLLIVSSFIKQRSATSISQ